MPSARPAHRPAPAPGPAPTVGGAAGCARGPAAARTMGNKQTIFTEEQLDNYQVSPRPSPRLSAAAAPPTPRKPAPGVTPASAFTPSVTLGRDSSESSLQGRPPHPGEAAQESPLL